MSDRNPIDTLNFQALLQVCGTATNAFENLAVSGGLRARRLLLLDSSLRTKHVDAEVLVNGRWMVVDPAFRVILRSPDGQALTRYELAIPAAFSAATRNQQQQSLGSESVADGQIHKGICGRAADLQQSLEV